MVFRPEVLSYLILSLSFNFFEIKMINFLNLRFVLRFFSFHLLMPILSFGRCFFLSDVRCLGSGMVFPCDFPFEKRKLCALASGFQGLDLKTFIPKSKLVLLRR